MDHGTNIISTSVSQAEFPVTTFTLIDLPSLMFPLVGYN